jgi:hypothetical protein
MSTKADCSPAAAAMFACLHLCEHMPNALANVEGLLVCSVCRALAVEHAATITDRADAPR